MEENENENRVHVTMFAAVTVDDTYEPEVVERATRLKKAFDTMKLDPITDPYLVNDVLDVMETVVNISRRAKALKRCDPDQ